MDCNNNGTKKCTCKYIIVVDYSGTAFSDSVNHQKDTGALCLNIPCLIKRFKVFCPK